MDVQEFGNFLQSRRKDLGMTQSELAEKIHVTDKAVSRWERGVGFPDIKLLEPLSNALEISLTELIQCRLLEEKQEESLREETEKIMQTQQKLSWQRKTVVIFGQLLIVAASFVLVHISHRQELSAQLRNVVYGIALLGTFFGSHALRFIGERLYLNSKPWGVWEKSYMWIGWGLTTVGFLVTRLGRNTKTGIWMMVGIAIMGIGTIYQIKKSREEEEEK